jgi:MFS family permease
LNGLSYLAVIASLLAMRVKPVERPAVHVGIVEGLRNGLEYISGSLPIRSILLLLGLVSMMSMPLTVLMPVIATDVLHGGPRMLGMLTASLGIGALVASLALAARKSVVGLGSLIALATALFGFGMIALSFSHVGWLSMILLLVIGFAMVVQMAASNTILQTVVDDDKRGRVMSFYAMAFVGMAPLGSLLSGCLASRLGTLPTMMLCGSVCLAGAAVFSVLLPGIRQAVKPIYIRAGLLPNTGLLSSDEEDAESDSLLDTPEIIPITPAAMASPILERSAA